MFPSLKGEFVDDQLRRFSKAKNWKIIDGYQFGGYAKVNTGLIAFINAFYRENKIPLDPFYTVNLFFGVI